MGEKATLVTVIFATRGCGSGWAVPAVKSHTTNSPGSKSVRKRPVPTTSFLPSGERAMLEMVWRVVMTFARNFRVFMSQSLTVLSLLPVSNLPSLVAAEQVMTLPWASWPSGLPSARSTVLGR